MHAQTFFLLIRSSLFLLMKAWEQGGYVIMSNRMVDVLGMMDHVMWDGHSCYMRSCIKIDA